MSLATVEVVQALNGMERIDTRWTVGHLPRVPQAVQALGHLLAADAKLAHTQFLERVHRCILYGIACYASCGIVIDR